MNGTTMMIIGIRFANRTRVLRKENVMEVVNNALKNNVKETYLKKNAHVDLI